MELKFLGRGAAFNPKEGNNSAYFIENKELFLLDCGEGIFERIIKNNTLNDIDKVNILITHTHSDHVGSIGSLIMYCFYIKKTKTNIILPADELFKNNLEQLLTILVVAQICITLLMMKNIQINIQNLVKYNIKEQIIPIIFLATVLSSILKMESYIIQEIQKI